MPISCSAVAASALTFLLLGCTHNNTQSYADAVLNRPMPSDDDSRMRECTWIRSEIARQQGLAGVGATMATTPLMAAAYQAMAAKHRGAGGESRQRAMHGSIQQRARRRARHQTVVRSVLCKMSTIYGSHEGSVF